MQKHELFNAKASKDSSLCDVIKVELHNSILPYDLIITTTATLRTDGYALVNLPAIVNGNNYYIALKHRNGIETWSKTPVAFSGVTQYDFTR